MASWFNKTRWSAAALATAALLTLAACSSSGSSSSGGAPPSVDPCTETNRVGPPPPTSVCPNGVAADSDAGASSDPADPGSSAASPGADGATPVHLTTAAFTLKLGDGTTIGATLKLSHVLPAYTDVDNAWSAVANDSSSPPCDVDNSRDGVVVGSIAFTNRTPSFTPNVDLQFQDGAGGSVTHSLGVGYSSDPECDDFSQYPNHGDIKPSFDSRNWGPVPIEIVVHNYYSPDNPDGDSSLLGDQSLDFIALATGGGNYSFYDTTSSSGLVQPVHINGLVYVQLGGLG